jgi:hypothetical protein
MKKREARLVYKAFYYLPLKRAKLIVIRGYTKIPKAL